jgi:hypothetical protein
LDDLKDQQHPLQPEYFLTSSRNSIINEALIRKPIVIPAQAGIHLDTGKKSKEFICIY